MARPPMGRPDQGGGSVSRGFALHVGLDRVDRDAYDGWDGTSQSSVSDADAMLRLSEALGYNAEMITNEDATSAAILTRLSTIAAKCTSSDAVFLTFSGHGGQVPNVLGEPGGVADTWVLYDRMLIDYELRAAFAGFPFGTRIVVISDCCHSGTDTYRMPPTGNEADERSAAEAEEQTEEPLDVAADRADEQAAGEHQAKHAADPPRQPRFIPPSACKRSLERLRTTYEAVQFASRYVSSAVAASVLLLAACQDDQIAWEDASHGAFTRALLNAWKNGRFEGDYASLIRSATRSLRRQQKPNLFIYGGGDLAAFETQRPFTIAVPEVSTTSGGFALTLTFSGQTAEPISVTVASGLWTEFFD